MTYRIDLSEDKQRLIEAAAGGVAVEAFIALAAEEVVNGTIRTSSDIPARLERLDWLNAVVESQPDRRKAAGVESLDLSGSRSDVYGYDEREAMQL
jgi:hypothetical protein